LAGIDQRHALPWREHRPAYSGDESGGWIESKGEAIRILIVEDDYLVSLEMEGVLADAGYEVAGIAATAEEALALAAEHRPLLAIMDIHLASRRDGIEAALELFRRHGIRSVFATAHLDERTRKRAEPARPLGWLAKPYTMPSLIAEVARAISQLDPKDD
jgi:DNA-binding NarL/FixJ family response regulator